MGLTGPLVEAKHLQNIRKVTSDVTDVEQAITKVMSFA